jgi:hypothetical protein
MTNYQKQLIRYPINIKVLLNIQKNTSHFNIISKKGYKILKNYLNIKPYLNEYKNNFQLICI